MADFIDFLPLFQESEETIRARMDNDANSGVDPSDPDYIDIRQGGFYYDVTQAVVIEMARLYDSIATELPATALPTFAWGEYLDYWAGVFNLSRKDATAATGYVTFVGVAGTLLPTGIQIAAEATIPDVEAPVFQTTQSGTIPAAIDRPTTVTASTSTTTGTLSAATYTYGVASLDGDGETTIRTVSATTTGSTGKVTLTWGAVTGATQYSVYRGGFYIGVTTAATFVDTGFTVTTRVPSATNTTGGRKSVAVEAVTAGTASNVGTSAVTVLISGAVITSVSNNAPISGGTDEETDESLRSRILLAFQPGGSGTVNDYKRWALTNENVDRVTVVPIWNGAGTVKVVIMDSSGSPVSAATVAAVQTLLDPTPARGAGLAPIGATVTVSTPTQVLVNVSATVVFEGGYSLDGDDGSIALRDQIVVELTNYVNYLEPSDDVVYRHIVAQPFRVTGVSDISALTINSTTANIAISTDQVARLGTVTLA